MGRELLGDEPVSRVIIVRARRGLGDFLLAIPALRAINRGIPGVRVTLVGVPWMRPVADRYPRYIHDFLDFPGFPGIPEVPEKADLLPGFLEEVRSMGFDLAIQMHGSGVISNIFTALLGARINAGYYIPGHYRPDTERFLVYPEHEECPEVIKNLKLVEHLGIRAVGDHLEFEVTESDRLELEEIRDTARLNGDAYACVHPGANERKRCWDTALMARVADHIAGRGLRLVLTGARGESDLTRELAGMLKADCIDVAGRTTLGSLAALLQGATLLVCPDTGVSHLAAALGVPSVVIFMVSDPDHWAPLRRDLHRVVGRPRGLRAVDPKPAVRPTVREVIRNVDELLSSLA